VASTGNFVRDASADLKFIRVHQFVEKSIGPWATHARISQLIAEDFDEMLLDQSVAAAVQVTFGKNATDNYTPQVGRAQFIQIAPSRVGPVPKQGGPSNVIHRGVTEQETIDGVAAVRLYVTVFSEAQVSAGGTSRYKDIHQNRWTKKISIYTGEGDSILWVNAGQPLRALKWLEKYKAQDPNAKPVIRSFCIPTADFLGITASAILEHDASTPANRDRTFNVDRHYASDQFGVRGDGLRILRGTAIKGSLITYAENPAHTHSDFGGDIRTVRELRDRLGVPEAALPNESVFVNGTDFQKKDRFAGIADKLMNIYATWMGNDLFATERWLRIPRLRRCVLMRQHMESYGIRIDEKYWTQINGGMAPARLAQTISSVTR
jgi:hypothetical protein